MLIRNTVRNFFQLIVLYERRRINKIMYALIYFSLDSSIERISIHKVQNLLIFGETINK